jgi:hypothetical protein
MTSDDLHQKLIAALAEADTASRNKRAERIIWMSNYNQRPSMIMGSNEALGVLSEAADAYRDGHFISVILLAQALIEHELVGELVLLKKAKGDESLVIALKLAKKNQVLTDELVNRIDQLRVIRNPFAHHKKSDHEHSFTNRYRTRKIHPQVLLQEDAQEAFKLMYEVFRALLREVS